MRKKLLVMFLFVLFLSFVLIACQSNSKDVAKESSTMDEVFESGKLALANGEYVKAKDQFEQVLAEDKEMNEAEDWLALTIQMEELSNYVETEEIGKAEEVIADIKGNDFYQAVTSLIDGYESTITTLKNSIEKIEHEIAELDKKLKEGDYQAVVEIGNSLKVDQIITEDQLDRINAILAEATAKREEAVKQADTEKQVETSAQEVEGNTPYSTYTNTRFGFSVDIPVNFTMAAPPDNNDGRKFYNEEATILAYAGYINLLEQNETIETYYNRKLEELSIPVAYKRLEDNWYVISYNEGSNIVYEKAIIGESVISHLIITYPSSKQDEYESMVTHVSHSFKGEQNE